MQSPGGSTSSPLFEVRFRHLIACVTGLPAFAFLFCVAYSIIFGQDVVRAMSLSFGSRDSSSAQLSVDLKLLALVTVSLPFFGFCCCVLCALYWHFDASTSTHCEVANFAPSISAAIGTEPQKFIWQSCIALHSAPRFLFACLNANHLRDRISLTPIRWIENFALLSLTIVSSQENFPFHKTAFATFIFCSFAYMCIIVYLISGSSGGYSTQNQYERKACEIKKVLLKLTVVFGLLMMYFYYRHNSYCEPYVYSLFCICEYCIVLANMGFHLTAYYDFHSSDVVVTKSSAYMRLPYLANTA